MSGSTTTTPATTTTTTAPTATAPTNAAEPAPAPDVENWTMPAIDRETHASSIPSSACWDNYLHDDDVFELPEHSPTFNGASVTLVAQEEVEQLCRTKIYRWLSKTDVTANARLNRALCIEYCLRGLRSVSVHYSNLDCSRTWISYWILNALLLLNAEPWITRDLQRRLVSFLGACQHPTLGGFAGGPQQLPHMASSFGAVMALMMLGTAEAYACVDRRAFYAYLLRNKRADGSFSVNRGGEVDIRAIYCGLACATVLQILDKRLCAGTLRWLARCQTYQGGFAQEPHDEAHGGYAYCGIAAVILILRAFPELYIEDEFSMDLEALIRWQAHKQMQFEGGFCGRTHKLVDACYSFWVGAVFPLIDMLRTILCACEALKRKRKKRRPAKMDDHNNNHNHNARDSNEEEEEEEEKSDDSDSKHEIANGDNKNNNSNRNRNNNNTNVNEESEEEEEEAEEEARMSFGSHQVLFHSLQLQKYLLICCQHHNGGIKDKPPKPADFYHTCYGLSGLSVAQHYYDSALLGPPQNKLQKIDAVYGIVEEKLQNAIAFYKTLPSIHDS